MMKAANGNKANTDSREKFIREYRPEWMRRESAAAYLNISPRCLSEWQKRRLIPYVKAGRK